MKATKVKERPILFSAAMVRAILEGRKTQTRRVIVPQPPDWVDQMGFDAFCRGRQGAGRGTHPTEGRAEWLFNLKFWHGDVLWVKETFWQYGKWVKNGRTSTGRQRWRFKAIGKSCKHYEQSPIKRTAEGFHKRPSIFMPRWASRIKLEVNRVRMERLQKIVLPDVAAEGVPPNNEHGWDSTALFRGLWDSINAERGFGWASNPWVVVVEFKVL